MSITLRQSSPIALACAQPLFGNTGDSQPQPAPSTPEPTAVLTGRKKKGCGPLALIGLVLALPLAAFSCIGGIIYKGVQMGQEMQTEVKKDAVGSITTLLGVEAAITKDNKIFMMGQYVGQFKADGTAWTADVRQIGHADEKGNLFAVQYPNKALGHVTEAGEIKVDFPFNVNAGTIKADHLTLQEKGAAAVIIAFHPDNNK